MDDIVREILRAFMRKSIAKTLEDLENAMNKAIEDMDDTDIHEINGMFKEELVSQVCERFGSLKVIEDSKGGKDQ